METTARTEMHNTTGEGESVSIELENGITSSGEMHGWGEGCNPACAGGGGILGLAQAGHGDIFTDGGLRNQDVDAWVALTLLGETRRPVMWQYKLLTVVLTRNTISNIDPYQGTI